MPIENANWQDTLLHLLALAARLEGEGQYNLAKLARGAADALSRQAAYQIAVPTTTDALAADIKQIAEALAPLGISAALIATLKQGADVMARGEVPLFSLIPHPYVCRTCGHLTIAEPTANCPTCGAWPGTFQRFMPNYWFDALEPLAAIERLRQTPLEVAELLAGLSDAQLNQTPPAGGWAMRNVVIHLRDAQDVFAYRVELFQQEEHPALESKAVWTWAASQEEQPPTVQEIFASYQTSRQATLHRLEQFPLADWWRTGQHQEFGVVTLRQQVSYFAAHEETHLTQLGALRAVFNRSAPSIGPGSI